MSTLLAKHRTATLVLSLLTLGLAIGGCGGSRSSQSAVQQARPTPAGSNADIAQTYASPTRQQRPSTQASARAERLGRPRSVQPAPTVQRARPTPPEYNDDAKEEPHAQFNPCTLVSVAEAEAIVGGPIAGRIDAPLGPTCVYKLSGSKNEITLTVESLGFPQATGHMARREAVTIGRHPGYCGRLGTDMLFLRLGPGQLLNVTAPCPIAQRFATLALSRLVA
ncbi:MAG TPA: hypothetical protein VEQ10_01115 [Vicinamibacteria bacterium]|nr:hypothetical protein [Vicinamibacteria bacterium]